jgi:hypothetical protein
MNNKILIGLAATALCFTTGAAMAGGHTGGGDKPKTVGVYSGFEGNEAELGKYIVAAINEASKANGLNLDYSGKEDMVGLAASKMIKTLESNSAYQHYTSDALVKMTLEFMQYAKDQGKLEEVARKDATTQFPMLRRVATLVEKTGDKELALKSITDQTACFFQLVGAVERAPGMVTYRAPYGHVLEQTTRMGMHDLTEEEIHNKWTKPHIEVWSDILGVDIQISDWQDDGMVTIWIPEVAKQVAAN